MTKQKIQELKMKGQKFSKIQNSWFKIKNGGSKAHSNTKWRNKFQNRENEDSQKFKIAQQTLIIVLLKMQTCWAKTSTYKLNAIQFQISLLALNKKNKNFLFISSSNRKVLKKIPNLHFTTHSVIKLNKISLKRKKLLNFYSSTSFFLKKILSSQEVSSFETRELCDKCFKYQWNKFLLREFYFSLWIETIW